jgi:hypothetical protein
MDLLILAESLPQVIDLARLQGYVLSAKPTTFAQGTVEIRRVSKLDSETGDLVSLDLLLVTPQLQAVWANRQQVSWEGDALSVVSRDGLIELKLLRGSGQDLDDINGCEAKPPMNPDMSDRAVTTRLKRVEQLRRLCLALGRAKPFDKIETQTSAAPLSNQLFPLSNSQSPTDPTTQCKTQ